MKTLVDIIDTPIDPGPYLQGVIDPSAGGSAVFLGTTRTPSEGREVAYLEYEVYRPMALKTMSAIVESAGKKWPLAAACAVHRAGRVAPGEASVLVAASSGHRAAAFEACRYLIDEIKKEVPIWKVEVYADGTRRGRP